MPGLGCVPARGNWEHRLSAVSSTATFQKGSLVNLDPIGLVREYLSTDSQWYGISLCSSTATLPGPSSGLGFPSGHSGFVLVAIPAPGCTFFSDLTTGITQSSLTPGQVSLIYKQGNLMSYASTVMGQASRFSAIVTIAGPIDATNSRVEVAPNVLTYIYYSASSHTYAT